MRPGDRGSALQLPLGCGDGHFGGVMTWPGLGGGGRRAASGGLAACMTEWLVTLLWYCVLHPRSRTAPPAPRCTLPVRRSVRPAPEADQQVPLGPAVRLVVLWAHLLLVACVIAMHPQLQRLSDKRGSRNHPSLPPACLLQAQRDPRAVLPEAEEGTDLSTPRQRHAVQQVPASRTGTTLQEGAVAAVTRQLDSPIVRYTDGKE